MSAYGEQENLCRRCGISCHPAIQVGRLKVVLPDVHCRFLGRDDGGQYACTVYESRFEKAPWCIWADEAKKESLLSVDCPYHQGTPDQQGKTFINDRLLGTVVPDIADQFLKHGVPEWVTTEGVLRVLERAGFQVVRDWVDDEGRRRFEVSK